MARIGDSFATRIWGEKLRLEDEVDDLREKNQRLQHMIDEAEAIFSYGVFHHTRVSYPFWAYWFRWRDDLAMLRQSDYPVYPEGWEPL